MFKTIEKEAIATVIEKKSKFIANIFYVESEKEAENKIEEIRKKYYDARHNCFAYRIIEKEGIKAKQSDDGEPSGTAGMPILGVLEKKELSNVLVVVTRYFGGILLGTGGLVKAYSDATKEAVEKAKEVEKEAGYVIDFVLKYENMKDFEYMCAQNHVYIIEKRYTENVTVKVEISEKNYKKEYFQNIEIEEIKEKYVNKN